MKEMNLLRGWVQIMSALAILRDLGYLEVGYDKSEYIGYLLEPLITKSIKQNI